VKHLVLGVTYPEIAPSSVVGSMHMRSSLPASKVWRACHAANMHSKMSTLAAETSQVVRNQDLPIRRDSTR
jgi:hypothetical protein